MTWMKSEKNMDCHRWHWYLLNTCKMLKYGQVLKKTEKNKQDYLK